MSRLDPNPAVAYALAKMLDERLLFKGNDFVLTDIAVYSFR